MVKRKDTESYYFVEKNVTVNVNNFIAENQDTGFSRNLTLYNVCSAPFGEVSIVGVFGTVCTLEDIMSSVGGILSTLGDIQYLM